MHVGGDLPAGVARGGLPGGVELAGRQDSWAVTACTARVIAPSQRASSRPALAATAARRSGPGLRGAGE